MKHSDILKLLTPVQLGDKYDQVLEAQGAGLDRAKNAADKVLAEILPDLTVDRISDWERLLALTPAADATLAARRQAVLLRFRMHGSLSRAYYVTLAASYGQTITIQEYVPAICGQMRCGDALYVAEARWMWTISGLNTVPQSFRCGMSCCGESLRSQSNSVEVIINRLKPAHTLVDFVYNG